MYLILFIVDLSFQIHWGWEARAMAEQCIIDNTSGWNVKFGFSGGVPERLYKSDYIELPIRFPSKGFI